MRKENITARCNFAADLSKFPCEANTGQHDFSLDIAFSMALCES